jgi:pathogenesis-related protein 1
MNIKTSILCMAILFGMSILRVQAQTIPDFTGSKLTKEEAQIALDFHNKVRTEVGVTALTWSPDLAKFAQEWADHLAS